MTKLRVGIRFANYEPTSGGGFSLISTLVESITNSDEIDFVLIPEEIVKGKMSILQLKKRLFRLLINITEFIIPRAGAFFESRTALEKLIKKQDLDLIFFLGSEVQITSIPYIMTIWDLQHRTHPWFPELSKGQVWDSREKYLRKYLPRAAVVITGTSQGIQEIKQFYGVDDRNVLIIPHVIDQNSVTSTTKTEHFIYPAQFWAHKNHRVIVESVKHLRDFQKKKVIVDFIGSDKGNLEFIKNLVSEFNLQEQINFHGFVTESKKYEMYANSIGMIYASFSGPENLPPLEAFSCNLPVIYGDFPGAREQLGDAAYYFEPGDYESLSRQILYVLNESEDNKNIRVRMQNDLLAQRTPEYYWGKLSSEIARRRLEFKAWR
jgi:glycosyltransferase involved in cell wall biosynthesis